MKGCTDVPMVPFHRVIRWDRASIGRRFASPSRLVLLMSPFSLPTQLQAQGMTIMDSAAPGRIGNPGASLTTKAPVLSETCPCRSLPGRMSREHRPSAKLGIPMRARSASRTVFPAQAGRKTSRCPRAIG